MGLLHLQRQARLAHAPRWLRHPPSERHGLCGQRAGARHRRRQRAPLRRLHPRVQHLDYAYHFGQPFERDPASVHIGQALHGPRQANHLVAGQDLARRGQAA
jgi:hypothetical protein